MELGSDREGAIHASLALDHKNIWKIKGVKLTGNMNLCQDCKKGAVRNWSRRLLPSSPPPAWRFKNNNREILLHMGKLAIFINMY